MNSTEQAPARRIPLSLDIEFRRNYARSSESGLLKNISISGAFLEHPGHELRANEKLAITFKVSGRVRKIIAHIIWANDRGCGIRFAPFNNRDVQIVDDLMYFVESHRESTKGVLDDIFKNVG